MQKIYLLFHGRFPSEKAASLFAAKSAEAFARQGCEVTVLVPQRKGVTEDVLRFYGVTQPFSVQYVPVLDWFSWPLPRKLVFWISFISYSLAAKRYLVRHAQKHECVYSNESLPLWLAASLFPHTAYEMHDFPESKFWLFRKFLTRVEWIVVHNTWKAKELASRFGIKPEKLLIEVNAVDINTFNLALTKDDARNTLGLPLEKTIIGYTGHLYHWKGVDTLAEAARSLPDFYFVMVGGTPEDVAKYQKCYPLPNIKWVGHRSHQEIPLWQRACDVVVLPNTAKEAISAYYTSPMKLFEYMASKTPIIASKLPSVEELVDERMVRFFEPDSVESLVAALRETVADPEAGRVRADVAYQAVRNHTWDHRARRILDTIFP